MKLPVLVAYENQFVYASSHSLGYLHLHMQHSPLASFGPLNLDRELNLTCDGHGCAYIFDVSINGKCLKYFLQIDRYRVYVKQPVDRYRVCVKQTVPFIVSYVMSILKILLASLRSLISNFELD